MRRVSFELAKALKKAGYPQGISDYQYTMYGKERHLINGFMSPTIIDAPYVLEAWIWMLREKKNCIIKALCKDLGWDYKEHSVSTVNR